MFAHKLYWLLILYLILIFILSIIELIIGEGIKLNTINTEIDPLSLVKNRRNILNTFWCLVGNRVISSLMIFALFMSFIIRILQIPVFIYFFIIEFNKYSVGLKNKNICIKPFNFSIKFIPTLTDMIKMIIIEQPRWAASVSVYNIFKFKNMRRTLNRNDIIKLIYDRMVVWLSGYSIWVLRLCFSFSVFMYTNTEIRKGVLWESILLTLSSFFNIYVSNNRIIYSKQKVYMKDGVVIFNPNKNEEVKFVYKTIPEFSNLLVKGKNHLRLAGSDNRFGVNYTSHPKPHMSTIKNNNKNNSFFVTNCIPNIKNINNNIIVLESQIVTSGVNDIVKYNIAVNNANHKQLSDPTLGIFSSGFSKDLKKSKGFYYKSLIEMNKDNIFNLNEGELKYCNFIAEAQDKLDSKYVYELSNIFDINRDNLVNFRSDNIIRVYRNSDELRDEIMRMNESIVDNNGVIPFSLSSGVLRPDSLVFDI